MSAIAERVEVRNPTQQEPAPVPSLVAAAQRLHDYFHMGAKAYRAKYPDSLPVSILLPNDEEPRVLRMLGDALKAREVACMEAIEAACETL